jgi:hypothetical protein
MVYFQVHDFEFVNFDDREAIVGNTGELWKSAFVSFVFAAFCLGLMSKQRLLLDYWLLKRAKTTLIALIVRERIPYLALSAASAGACVTARFSLTPAPNLGQTETLAVARDALNKALA